MQAQGSRVAPNFTFSAVDELFELAMLYASSRDLKDIEILYSLYADDSLRDHDAGCVVAAFPG